MNKDSRVALAAFLFFTGMVGAWPDAIAAQETPPAKVRIVLVGDNPVFGASDNPSGLAYPAAGAFATIPQLERGSPRAAPQLGAHSDEILATRLGLSSGQIAALHDKGLIAQS